VLPLLRLVVLHHSLSRLPQLAPHWGWQLSLLLLLLLLEIDIRVRLLACLCRSTSAACTAISKPRWH
jgi:hypothetical protein